MNAKVKKIVYGGLLVAIGVLLPQLFHIFGQAAGKTFLPMHIPVMLAGLLIGPLYGAGVALLVPIISSLITGMPPVPMLYFMLLELIAYAVLTGIFYQKLHWNIYPSLLLAMVGGRIVYGFSLIAAVNFLGLHLPFANLAAFFGGIVSGLPGILIQIVIIPPIVYALHKGGLVLEQRRAN